MRNNKCFVDTSALIALNDAKNQYHATSHDIAATLKSNKLMITDAVINETYNILRYRLGFHNASYFLRTILTNDQFIIADVTPLIRMDTLQLLVQYSDHKISYCDALSVAIMKKQQINKIFAFDHHFEMMGVQLIRL